MKDETETQASSTKAKKTEGDKLIDVVNLLKESNVKMFLVREES